MEEEDEACRCVIGEIGFGILAEEVDDCGSCGTLFAIIGLTSVKLDVRGSRLVLEVRGDPACSGMLEAILSCLAERSGDLEQERERLRRCLGYPKSRRNPGLFGDIEDLCLLGCLPR
jgi:hypothetical protein